MKRLLIAVLSLGLTLPSAFAANIAVFDNPIYVDTANRDVSESDNIQASLLSRGHTVNAFTGITAADFTAAFASNDVVFFPDMEGRNLNLDLDSAARSAIFNAVSGGRTIVTHAQTTPGFLNGVFGLNLSTTFLNRQSILDVVTAAGTPFEGGPATIARNFDTFAIRQTSLPLGSRIIYADEFFNDPTVAIIPVGRGQIIYLGWDWVDSDPPWPGGQDGGWIDVLDRAVQAAAVAPTPVGVDISAPTPSPVLYAQEIVASTSSPVTLVNNAGSLNLTSVLGYSFSQGEVRHARVECPSTVRFLAGSTVVSSDDPASTIGALNGLGSNVITFSITAVTNGLTADDTITVTGDRSITATTSATCSFSLYDNPSEAQAGGENGRIVTRSGPYLAFGPSWQLVADPVFTSTANVEANPAFTAFVAAGDTTTTRAGLSELTYDLTTPTPLRIDGNPITLADLMATGATGTRLVVTGDFAAAANADGSFTGAALNRVFLATDDTCTTLATAASALTATTATFAIGATARTDDNLCLQVNGTTAIPAAEYTVQVLPVAASAAYAVSSSASLAAGRIVRNGTELMAPLVQTPNGFISRIVLTNTGTIARPATWNFRPATGATASEANTTYTGPTTGTLSVPANGSIVVNLVDVLGTAATNFGGTPPRGVFTVDVAGPNAEIQGLYQIVNPATGAFSNHVMVRPGTN